jgi:hypothetical protein
LAVQTWLTQSVSTMQTFPVEHGLQTGPPQSTSVSVPFLSPSRQLDASQTPATQSSLVQSVSTAHFWAVAHGAQTPPPQSTSVSVPFWMPSVHEDPAAWQMPATQSALVQSLSAAHSLPVAHLGQLGPPQSTSVSVPS